MKDAPTITSTHLAKNLSDVLNRVQYQGSQFIIERNGTQLATLGPVRQATPIGIQDWLRRVEQHALPGDGFADDLEQVVSEQQDEEVLTWPSS